MKLLAALSSFRAVKDGVTIEKMQFLARERKTFVRLDAVTTVDFFRGGEPPIGFLRERVQQILQQNPWLAGALVKDKTQQVVLQLPPPQSISTDKFLMVLDDDQNLRTDLSFSQMSALLQPHLVKIPIHHIGSTDEPLLKILVFRQPNEFALVLSMSHILGDGYTYYRIHSMLGQNGQVDKLDPKRELQFDQMMKDVAEKDNISFLETGRITTKFISGAIFAKRANHFGFYFNDDWIKREKQQHQPSVEIPFISTNDILTSWFLKKFQLNIAFMAVNCRSRVKTLSETSAGNYVCFVPYIGEEDYKKPSLIRASLKTLKRQGKPATDLPGWWSTLTGKLGLITTWASYKKTILFDGCTPSLHLPMFPIRGNGAFMESAGIVFEPSPGRVGMLVISPSMTYDELKSSDSDGAVGDSIF